MDLYNASTDFEEDSELALSPEEYEERVTDLKQVISNAEEAVELTKDPKWKNVVNDGFFKGCEARLVGLITTGGIARSVCDAAADDLRGIGVFKNYMREVVQMGVNAKAELDELERAWNEHIEAQEAQS